MSIWSLFYLISQCLIAWHIQIGVVDASQPVEYIANAKHQNGQLDSNAKYIYLSFDDGPLFGTSSCIDICEQENVKATFFQIGFHQSRSQWGKRLYQRILDQPDLFLLSNHSFSHTYGDYLKFYHQPDSALEDFKQAAVVLNTKNNIVRLPGNNGWSTATIHSTSKLVRPLVHKLDSAGFNVVGWDVEWRFTKTGRPIQSAERMAFVVDSMFQHNENRTKNHLILLMHDHMFRKADDSIKLVQFVQYLKYGNKYQFVLLDQYPGLKNQGINNF
jgi:peptidoglycan/xylan/chitin deacetylase (PgdA/CDA1 family)